MHFDVAIFDMDGVITDTAQVHAAAWKETFDSYLQDRAALSGNLFEPFTQTDYLAHVDGRPRYEGVDTFLRSHQIDLPFGDPGDMPEQETVCGLGNSKDASFNRILRAQGVKVFGSTIALILALRRDGVKVAVATSSKNGALVLNKAGIAEMFETRVDGVVSAELGLMGKPAPDIFVEACERLGACRHRAMIVEDAVTGVQAGVRGRFGLTLGVAREGNSEALRQQGADIVVSDLSQISVDEIDHWFETVVRTRPGAPGERHTR
ncbi:MAG: HAD hydrolase-like protein [Rhizomicrobium sp.]|nr:HAD hydrolase-like protein [Rhizomicrobium sp.]